MSTTVVDPALRLGTTGALRPTLVRSQLAAFGHEVQNWPDWTLRAGAVCAIEHEHATGVKAGAADPRRTSYAVGW